MKIGNFFQKNKTINEDMEDYFYEEETFENENVEPLESFRENTEEQNTNNSTEDIDIPNLIKKLNYLDKKYDTDLDVICLKALCSSPDSEGKIQAVEEILKNLISKYPKDIKIRELIYNDRDIEIPLKNLISILEERYKSPEVVIIKALANTPNSLDRENSLRKYLIKLLQNNPADGEIRNYLGAKKERKENMVFIESTTFLEVKCEKNNMSLEEFKKELVEELDLDSVSFLENKKICNLYASKYLVTQEEWEKFMGTNPSTFKDNKKPVENINWIEALEFCNKLSQYYNLQPVYKIQKNTLEKIIYKDGEEVEPNLADFSKTEGYRLPIYFETLSFGLENTNADLYELGWYGELYDASTHEVGLKKTNKYGMYDVVGNVKEWCYDVAFLDDENIKIEYIYNKVSNERLVIGGAFDTSFLHIDDFNYNMLSEKVNYLKRYNNVGFRIVRTAERL